MTTTVYDDGFTINVDPDAKPGTFTGPTGLTAVGFAGELAASGSLDAIVHIWTSVGLLLPPTLPSVNVTVTLTSSAP